MKIVGWAITKKMYVYMSIFSPKKGQNITVITKKGEKILMFSENLRSQKLIRFQNVQESFKNRQNLTFCTIPCGT